MKQNKGYPSIVIVSILFILFRFYTGKFLLKPPENIFTYSFQIYILIDYISALVLFAVLRKLFNFNVGLASFFVYAVSPWSIYSSLLRSEVLLVVNLILILFWVIVVGSSSKMKLFMLLVALFVLFILMGRGINSISIQQYNPFSNVGLINYVNDYRGILRINKIESIGWLIENRYLYYARYELNNILKHVTPATFFSNQEKLVGASFSPPLFIGFLPFFVVGMLEIIKRSKKLFLLLVGVFLVISIPSIFSQVSPNLLRLYATFPLLATLTGVGFNVVSEMKKHRIHKLMLAIILAVLAFQLFVVIFDIATRELFRVNI